MHDIYAYGLGLYTLIATVLLTEFTAEKTSLLFRQERQNIKRGLWIGGIRLAKWTYLIVVAGIILPLLCGACLDLYVMMPFKRLMSPGSKVEMQVMQDWAFGVIHLKIAGRIILYLDGRHAQAMRNVPPPPDPSLPRQRLSVDFPRTLDKPQYPSRDSKISRPYHQIGSRSARCAPHSSISLTRGPQSIGDGTVRRGTCCELFDYVSCFHDYCDCDCGRCVCEEGD